MTLRITDQRSPSKCCWSGSNDSQPNKLGTYRSIDSVYSGAFEPGNFRLNPVTITKYEMSASGNSFQSPSYPANYANGDIAARAANVVPFSNWDSNAASYAMQEAYGKLSKAEAEVGVIIGELRETLHMLRHPFEAIQAFLRSKSLTRYPTLTSNLWLQYRYGIRPLIGDIQDVMKAYQKVASQLSILRSERGGTTRNSHTKTSVDYQGGPLRWTAVTNTDITDSYNAIVYYKLVSSRSSLSKWGVDIPNLPSIAWELVPYSFVVDWFLGVGNWLRAIKPTQYLVILGNCVTHTCKGVRIISGSNVKIANQYGIYQTPSGDNGLKPYITAFSQMTRRVNQPVPEVPALNPSALSLIHDFDALCLSWQKLKIRR